jgi:hypothetical protein
VISTVLEPGGTGVSAPSPPQVNTIRCGGSTAKKWPEAKPSPRTFIRNTPPGRASISAAMPCQDSHRTRSVKKENTVAGAL